MPLINLLPYRAKSSTSNTTLLLMHMEGTNGGTTFNDEYGATAVSSGAVGGTTDTSVYKFGSSSLSCGTNKALAISDPTGKFNFTSTNDFTAECWINVSALGSQSAHIFGNFQWRAGYQGGWRLILGSQGYLAFVGAGNTFYTSTANIIATNTWYHVAVSRQANLYRIFVNGTLRSNALVSTPIPKGNLDTYFRLGAKLSDPNVGIDDFLYGHIDEFRISAGCLYATNFTVPTAAFRS